MKIKAYILLFLFTGILHAQTKRVDSLSITSKSVSNQIPDSKAETDTSEADWFESPESILLEKVEIVSPMKFYSRDDRREYLLLQRKIKRVWPYVIEGTDYLNELHNRLDSLDSKSDQRRYIRIVQKYVENEFKDELKKLTKSEGQIMVKLIYRQNGITAYDIVKDLRTGWRAFRYNLTANIFTISIKETYNPLENKEDYFIEHILRRGFQMNTLKYQEPSIELDYSKILEEWHPSIEERTKNSYP